MFCPFAEAAVPQARRNLPGFMVSTQTPNFNTVDTMAEQGISMVQTGIFEDLQCKIDEDTAIKDVSGGSSCVHPPNLICGPATSRYRSDT
jgi:hypothetical protein